MRLEIINYHVNGFSYLMKYFFKFILTLFIFCSFNLNSRCQASWHIDNYTEEKILKNQLREVDAIKNAPFIFEGKYIRCEDVTLIDTAEMEVYDHLTHSPYYHQSRYCEIKVLHVYKGNIQMGDTIELFNNSSRCLLIKDSSGEIIKQKLHNLKFVGDFKKEHIFYCKAASKKSFFSRTVFECYEEHLDYQSVTAQFSYLSMQCFNHSGLRPNIGKEFQLQKMLNANPNLVIPEKYSYIQKY